MKEKQRDFVRRVKEFNASHGTAVPSLDITREFTGNMIHALFPVKRNQAAEEKDISLEMERCSIKLKELLYSIRPSLSSSPEGVVEEFFSRVPAAFEQLVVDADAIARFDPAASGIEEIILCYPGFFCISVYRLAHILYELKVPVLARVMSEYAHEKTGIDIHPGAEIDSPFFIDHGTGIVIGETARIGKEVKMYQGVTLGARSVEKRRANTKRHPTIEDHVIIYAGSTILGGSTVIGHHSVVGGNTWITESIQPHSLVYRNHRVEVREIKDSSTKEGK